MTSATATRTSLRNKCLHGLISSRCESKWALTGMKKIGNLKREVKIKHPLLAPPHRTSIAAVSQGMAKKMKRINESARCAQISLCSLNNEFSVLSTRFRFGGRKISKCACSELIGPSRSRPRAPI